MAEPDDDDKRSWMQRAEEDDVLVPYLGYMAFVVGLGAAVGGFAEGDYWMAALGVVATVAGGFMIAVPPRPPRK